MTLVFVLLACSGFTFILKYGSILSWLRKPLVKIKFFNELFYCSLCLGFWVGIATAVILYFIQWDKVFILLPFASASFCWFMDSFVGVWQWLEKYLENKNK